MEFSLEITQPFPDYELIDSGMGEKLERYGPFRMRRPDPQALWEKSTALEKWNNVDAEFVRNQDKGIWKLAPSLPERWPISIDGIKMWVKPTSFKHTGVFPEQSQNWKWSMEKIQAAPTTSKPVKVLNLFGYTGGATLAAASAGADVTHVDGSKTAVTWARENAELSGLHQAPIRWIVDDVRDFVKREIKRGNHYDAIIMDPPAFGRGADKQVWKIEDHMVGLLSDCARVLSTEPLFFLLNGYASGYSALAYKNMVSDLCNNYGGQIEYGEVALAHAYSDRVLPAGIFARWSRHT